MELQEDGVDLFESGLGLAAGGFDEEAEAEFFLVPRRVPSALHGIPSSKTPIRNLVNSAKKSPQSPSAESLPFPPFP